MDFYQQAAGLILGTRLKRLSEKFLQEIGLIYQELGIEFEPSWFPVFYLLQEGGPIAMTDMAARLDVSHSAISQMVSSLRKKGLVALVEDGEDGRKKKVSLTKAGKNLLHKVKPVWTSMDLAMQTLWEDKAYLKQFLAALDQLEGQLEKHVLSAKVLAFMPDLDYQLVRLQEHPYQGHFESFKQESESRFLDLPEGVLLWGVWHANGLIGALALLPTKHPSNYILWQVFVKTDFRKKGLATALLHQAFTDLELEKASGSLRIQSPEMPLIRLLIKEAFTFTINTYQTLAS